MDILASSAFLNSTEARESRPAAMSGSSSPIRVLMTSSMTP